MAGEIAAEWIKIPDGNGGLSKVWVRDSTARRSIAELQTEIAGLSASDVGAIPSSQKGAASGVAELDINGKVPSSQLPSYVDDVLEYASSASFPAAGESGKIYVDLGTNLTYRWSGSAYVEISPSLALGTTSSTAFRGDHGSTAYEHAVNKGSAFASGLYKITTNAEGHVTGAAAVAKADITALGIPGSAPSKMSDLTNDAGYITSETDPTVPSWAKASTKPSYTAAEVGALPDDTVIPTVPTNVSAFVNDAGYLTSYTETDPTVPSWAKTAAKPTYTASEVGALPDDTRIPSATSDLTNDSGFITAADVPNPASTAPVMDGVAAAGSSADYARGDHVHPSDTSKQNALSAAQLAAVNSGITADDLAINDASVLCTVTPIAPTLTAGAHYTAQGGCWYYKIGHTVHVHISVSGITSAADVTLWTLPAGYRPYSTIAFVGNAQNINTIGRFRVLTDGTVHAHSTGAYAVGYITFDAFA